MSKPDPELKRSDFFKRPLVDGRAVSNGPLARLGRRSQSLLVSRRECDEAELEARLRAPGPLTRPNLISVGSLRGGSGTTTVSLLVASLLASHRGLWTVVVDANPVYGSLTSLAPADLRPHASLGDLISNLDKIDSSGQLYRYVARMPTGLHLLGGENGDELASNVSVERFGELLAFLAIFYAVVVVDTAGRHPLAQLASDRADQTFVVTPPDPASAGPLAPLLEVADPARTTIVNNRPPQWRDDDSGAVAELLSQEGAPPSVEISYDAELEQMLAAGTYELGRLRSQTRTAIKLLGIDAVDRLV